MSPLREWIQNQIPDLRIVRQLKEGCRELTATFSVGGLPQSIGPVGGEDPEADIEEQIATVLRESLGYVAKSSRSLEREIVKAALNGDEAGRLALTAEYIRAPSRTTFRRPRSRWTI